MAKPPKPMLIAVFEDQTAFAKLQHSTQVNFTDEFVKYEFKNLHDGYGTVIEYEVTNFYSKATKARTWQEISTMIKVCAAVNSDFEKQARQSVRLKPPAFAAVVVARW